MRHDAIFRCISTMQTLAVSASFLEEPQFSTTICPSPVASDRASWSLSLEKLPWICYDLQIESNRARIKTGHHPMLTLLNPLALPRVVIHSFLFLCFFFTSFSFYHLWTFICLWNWDIQLAAGAPNYHRCCHFPNDQLGLEIMAIARQMLRHWHLFSKNLALEATGTASKTCWDAIGNAFLPSIHVNSS